MTRVSNYCIAFFALHTRIFVYFSSLYPLLKSAASKKFCQDCRFTFPSLVYKSREKTTKYVSVMKTEVFRIFESVVDFKSHFP